LDILAIKASEPGDLEKILQVERMAFGSDEEARLVKDLFFDPSAEPILSLLATQDNQVVGHILFSKANLDPPIKVKTYILAPLAVIPAFQKQGIGDRLIQTGIQILANWRIDWIFVLGHESYYPRFGFSPALALGFEPPFQIAGEFTNAWMALTLTPTCINSYHGRVVPADALNRPHYWRE
jgi:putative acetyltransferase